MNINEYRKKFYNLLENKLGNVKPLISDTENKVTEVVAHKGVNDV